MPRPKRPPSPWLSLLGLLWRQPLYAVPFAIFFGTLNGASRAIYVLAYVVSLFFAYAIGLALWTLEHFVLPRLEDHAITVSSKQVSGDFYDVVPAGPDAFLLAIADVAGKGVPAALLSSMLQASLRTQAGAIPSVAAILKNINTLVYRSTAVHQFATFFLARVEESTLRLAYSNAGHNYPVVFRNSGERVTLERGGTVVGILESAEFEEDHLVLEPGDRVVFYTDGINEAANASGELFGEERLCRLVASLPAQLSASETTERILE